MTVFIFESLREIDPKTGKQIHEFLNEKGIPNEFNPFHSKNELLDLLREIKKKIAINNIQPYVHFDCHGNDDGIVVVKNDGTEELITWGEIRDAFEEIYIASGQQSIICMSSCEGFNVAKLVACFKPCPYKYVCGSFEKISFQDSYNGYTKFYELIFNGTSIHDATVEIHTDLSLEKLKFLAYDSKQLYKIGFDGYINTLCTEEKLKQRKESAKTSLSKDGHISREQIDKLNHAYSLEGQKELLERYAKIFFSLQ
ncbi:hypothetical protein AGMMS49965_17230 [Bacteroidia bacterium]|nr:hypothetical protein AGMMS49965_17230 [Bacteroidia bacterium]